jgi:hypothetical protein
MTERFSLLSMTRRRVLITTTAMATVALAAWWV